SWTRRSPSPPRPSSEPPSSSLPYLSVPPSHGIVPVRDRRPETLSEARLDRLSAVGTAVFSASSLLAIARERGFELENPRRRPGREIACGRCASDRRSTPHSCIRFLRKIKPIWLGAGRALRARCSAGRKCRPFSALRAPLRALLRSGVGRALQER